MVFSTKEAKTFVESSSKYLSAGIVDNVNISEVKFNTSPQGNKFISITFMKNDSTVNMTAWEPKLFPGESQDSLKDKYLKIIYRLGQIVESFYPVGDPATECEVENFEQLAKWFIDAMENRDKTKLVRVKFVYNKDGYLTVPNYAKYRFIEPMEKPENWDKDPVEINDRDQLTRPIIADPVKSTANPFKSEIETQTTTVDTVEQPKGDLPF